MSTTLTQEEKMIQSHVESYLDTYTTPHASQQELLFHTHLAQQHISSTKKNKQISFRLPEGDLIQLKAIANHKGIPYQTYLSSLIHTHVQKEGMFAG